MCSRLYLTGSLIVLDLTYVPSVHPDILNPTNNTPSPPSFQFSIEVTKSQQNQNKLQATSVNSNKGSESVENNGICYQQESALTLRIGSTTTFPRDSELTDWQLSLLSPIRRTEGGGCWLRLYYSAFIFQLKHELLSYIWLLWASNLFWNIFSVCGENVCSFQRNWLVFLALTYFPLKK